MLQMLQIKETGRSMIENGQTKLETLRRNTQENPSDGWAWVRLGDFLLDESEYPNLAIRAYEEAQSILVDNDLRLRLGRAYVINGLAEKGLALIRASAMERPRAEALCFLSDAYFRCDQLVEAEGCARKAIEIEPDFEESYYLLGEAIKKRDPVAAIEAYCKAITLDPKYALAWQKLGALLIRSESRDKKLEGVNALARSVELDHGDIWSRVFLANGYWRIGRRNEAEEQYLAAIALEPEWEDLKRWCQEFKDESREP